MFSYILKIQAFFEKFKKNKGLFFSTLTTVSFITIVVSMYYLNTVADRTASTFYKQERVDVIKFVDDQLVSKSEKLLPIAILMAKNEHIVKNMQLLDADENIQNAVDVNQSATDTTQTDMNATENIAAGKPATNPKEEIYKIILAANKEISEYSTSGIDIEIYDAKSFGVADAAIGVIKDSMETDRAAIIESIAKSETLVGLEQFGANTVLRAITPITDGAKVLGVLEVRQDIGFLTQALEDQGYEFIFALDRFAFPNEYMRELTLKEINERYVTAQKNINTDFFEYLKDVDFKELVDDEYVLDSDFFATYKMVQDVEGVNFGIMLIGENMDKPSNILKVVDGVSKSITTVALGLVVALLLLMI